MPFPPKKKMSVQSRRKLDRQYQQIRRENEATESKETRKEADKITKRKRRASETPEETETRKEADRITKRKTRASETPEETETRTERKRISMAKKRASETPEETETRKEADKITKRKIRASEIPEETETRKESAKITKRKTRASETPEETETRTEKNRISMARKRAFETDENAEIRREHQKIIAKNLRQLKWSEKENAAYSYNPSIDYASDSSCCIGSASIICPFCSAMKFNGEARGFCCSSGKVDLPQFSDPPEPLYTLLVSDSAEAKHFRSNIRSYNSCFQMTSFGTTKNIIESPFMPTFKVQGQIYHRIGSVLPLPHEEPKFLQIYFTGDDIKEAQKRCEIVQSVKQKLVLELQQMLHRENVYIQSFKSAIEKLTPEYRLVIYADKTPPGEHERRYNAPSTSEVGVIMVGEEHAQRDIVLETRSRSIQKIADTHRSYDSLQYPIIFWQGEDGYHFQLKQRNPSTGEFTMRKITSMEFYAYRLMFRASSFNIVLRCNELFHQYIVDMYAKIESERLRYIRHNQEKLRVEEYIHLKDAIINDGNISQLGQLVILPSSFTGGPRYMHERTQDAMTYVRTYGRPDLFITITCNPAWNEIRNELFPGQRPQDRHDLLARVFHEKLKVLMNLITKGKIFGSVRCYMYTVEWQKRGLPHAHILIWLQVSVPAGKIDDFICAEIPNADEDPELFNCITKHMIHGPCGYINPNSPCMKGGKCTRRYPRDYLKETQTGKDGYPLYRRRKLEDGGFTAKVHVQRTEFLIDNRWIVPYCPLLSKIFNAHINIEYCNSIKSIKYVCKYINKGSDMAVFDLTNENVNKYNEVHQYQMGRYISSNEAIWRIFNFPIHERHPTVIHLSVHLENGQRVYFNESNAAKRAQVPPETTLTAFFRLCSEDIFARSLFYYQVPKYYTWDNKNKNWRRRKVGKTVEEHPGIKSSEALGRVYTVHPQNHECFYLRLLLHEVKGPTSFHSLKSVEGKVCSTYKEACHLRGILEDDNHWDATLEEAAMTRSPKMLRVLFAIMLKTCGISNPNDLWIRHRESLSEDILHDARVHNHNMDLEFNDTIFNRTLIIIEDKIKNLGGLELKSFGMPQPNRHESANPVDAVLRESNYDPQELKRFLEENENKMVSDQKTAYDKIIQAVFEDTGGIFFLDAPGGTGKTFLVNLILAKVRQRNYIALAVASSGIAATLLTGGRTAHSTFKLPLNLTTIDSPTCNISRSSDTAKLLESCRLIVWDECTMSHKAAFQALDVTMQDLRKNSLRMGGVTLVLVGDFRQTLPVIPRGTRADEMNACLRSSYLWRDIQRLQLKTNMRVHLSGDPSAQQFSDKLLKLGNGSICSEDSEGFISMEGIGKLIDDYQKFLESVFPNLSQNYQNLAWLCQRAILAPQNETVSFSNRALLSRIPGNITIYKSIDSICVPNEAVNYPTEFLNSLELPGVPSHILELKIGAPIILLRNLDPPSLCNGTRLCVKQLLPNVIEASIITGKATGTHVFIPRIPIIPSDTPFQFQRLQFPIRLSFAMSINKAQGQSLQVVGLDLRNPCFSHGQLYVGCSRVSSGENLYIYSPNKKTINIVYPEVLQ